MKQMICKRAVAILSALVMGIMLMANVPMTAKADNGVSDEQVQEIVAQNKSYREMLEKDVWGAECDGPAYGFGLVDVNGDGFNELIVDSNNPEAITWEAAGDFVAWKEGKIVWSWSSYILSSMYYSPSTGCIMIMENYVPNSGTPMNNVGNIYIFGYSEECETEELLYVNITNGAYINPETNIAYTELEIAEIETKIKEYMPEKVLLEAPYEITGENLNKYLPIDEGVVREMLEQDLVKEVTTEMITLKVGEAWGVSYENVDKLLAEAGYDYKSNPNVVPYIFYGDRVEMDAEYFARTAGVDIYDVNAQKVLERMYVADEEWAEVLEKDENGYYAEKYGVEVWLVEEAEGQYYYARAEKEGTATITIPEYPVASGETITVNIPVVIEKTTVVAPDTIISNTDTGIVLDNKNGVLPSGTTFTSAKLESGDVYNNAEKIIKENVDALVKYAVYELNLTDGNGLEINQLNGKVSVTMDVPFTMSKNTVLKVYRVENDTLVNCPATVSNGKVTFETDHFSTYIFAEETAAVTVPNTGDTSPIVNFILLMVAGISLCGVVVFGKRYDRV